jgi:hypothetical protein
MPWTPGRRPCGLGNLLGHAKVGGRGLVAPVHLQLRPGLHGSVINNKSAPLPEGENIRPEVERFLRRLGYRLGVERTEPSLQGRPGDNLQLAMKWQNVGSAPCYKPYRVAYRLANDQGYEKVFVGTVTVNKWLPGSIELFTEEFFKEPADLPPGEVVDVADSIQLPRDLSPGTTPCRIAVVGQEDTKPRGRAAWNQGPIRGWMVSVEHRDLECPTTRTCLPRSASSTYGHGS